MVSFDIVCCSVWCDQRVYSRNLQRNFHTGGTNAQILGEGMLSNIIQILSQMLGVDNGAIRLYYIGFLIIVLYNSHQISQKYRSL